MQNYTDTVTQLEYSLDLFPLSPKVILSYFLISSS